MGKYALGNPKNNWSDRFWDVKPNDFVLVHWQSDDEDEVARTTTRIAAYEVVEKACRFNDSTGMYWKLRDALTDCEHEYNLNVLWDTHIVRARKMGPAEVVAFKNNPQVELPVPPLKRLDPRVNYKHEFDTQGGKYPKPAKPKQYLEPVAGEKYRLMNFREGDYRYDVIVQGIELWGVGNPRAVAYKRISSDALERRTVDYFKFNFHLMRD